MRKSISTSKTLSFIVSAIFIFFQCELYILGPLVYCAVVDRVDPEGGKVEIAPEVEKIEISVDSEQSNSDDLRKSEEDETVSEEFDLSTEIIDMDVYEEEIEWEDTSAE